MAKKRSRSARSPAKKEVVEREQTFSAKLIQLVCDGHTLYGLDEQGRVFAYVERPYPRWLQIENDDFKHIIKKVDLDTLGKEHASRLPDDQRHAITMERDRERRERQWEALERILPMLDTINNNISGLYNRVFAMEEKVKKNGVETPTGAG